MRKDGIDKRMEDVWFQPGASDRRGAAEVRRELTTAIRRERIGQTVLWEGRNLLDESDGESLTDMRDKIDILTKEALAVGIQPAIIDSIHLHTDKTLGILDRLEL